MPWTTATTRATGFPVTAAVWNSEHVDNMNYLKEVNYNAFTSDASITQTTVGTAGQIIATNPASITYENVPHMIEFYCPRLVVGTQSLFMIVRDGSTVLGTMGRWVANETAVVHASFRVVPTAASHSYNIAAWNSAAATSVFNAGTGGTAGDATTDVAGFIRVFRVPT
jgi:hypothetical protein